MPLKLLVHMHYNDDLKILAVHSPLTVLKRGFCAALNYAEDCSDYTSKREVDWATISLHPIPSQDLDVDHQPTTLPVRLSLKPMTIC